LPPGTTTGQTTLDVPPNTATGDYVIEARTEALVHTNKLRVFATDTPRLVSFTVTPEIFYAFMGGTIRVDVSLDRPALAGGAVVVFKWGSCATTGGQVGTPGIPEGSTSASTEYQLLPMGWSAGPRPLALVTQRLGSPPRLTLER
jgi:hypothetical protein